jgi:hypothetical protein
MSPSEVVLGFVAIILGLAVADIAHSIHRLLRARDRVRWHWYPFSAAFLLILMSLQLWWDIGAFDKTGVKLTIGMFLPLVMGLMLLYLSASASLPDEVPKEGLDLKAYYFEQQRYFWILFASLLALFMINRIGLTWSVRGFEAVPRLLRTLVPNVVLLALIVSLAFIRKRWWHTLWLAILPVAVLVSTSGRALN